MKWEYTHQNAPTLAKGLELLNGFGQDGWELVQVVTQHDVTAITLVLKREFKEPPPERRTVEIPEHLRKK